MKKDGKNMHGKAKRMIEMRRRGIWGESVEK